MGKIKGENFVNKPEREGLKSKPPSMRRAIRAHKRGFEDHRTKRGQHIPATLVLKIKKKIQPRTTVMHGLGSDGKMILSSRVVKQLTAPLSDRVGVRDLREAEAAGQGELHIVNKRTIWHDLAVTI